MSKYKSKYFIIGNGLYTIYQPDKRSQIPMVIERYKNKIYEER
jgi:hypothetical protein